MRYAALIIILLLASGCIRTPSYSSVRESVPSKINQTPFPDLSDSLQVGNDSSSPELLLQDLVAIDNSTSDLIPDLSEPLAQPPPLKVPAPNSSFQWQLDGALDQSVNASVFDIDLFGSSPETVSALHAKNAYVICYISAGTWEDFREDAWDFPSYVKGKSVQGWKGEKWLDIRKIDVLGPIMRKRMDQARSKGCDGVEPDNIDSYGEDTGFQLDFYDQLRYNLWLTQEAHKRNLSIGLKNDADQIRELVGYYDWALAEDCYSEGWCDRLKPFSKAGKAVFMAEYVDTGADFRIFCPYAKDNGFSAILKDRGLGAWIMQCQ
ncbi:MAG: endo alpha-1,4 polygalactosaminidase [Candidatus Micrarchaeia archaeon]